MYINDNRLYYWVQTLSDGSCVNRKWSSIIVVTSTLMKCSRLETCTVNHSWFIQTLMRVAGVVFPSCPGQCRGNLIKPHQHSLESAYSQIKHGLLLRHLWIYYSTNKYSWRLAGLESMKEQIYKRSNSLNEDRDEYDKPTGTQNSPKLNQTKKLQKKKKKVDEFWWEHESRRHRRAEWTLSRFSFKTASSI